MIVKIDETLLVETDHGITDKSSAHSVHSNSNSFAEGRGLRAKLPKITLTLDIPEGFLVSSIIVVYSGFK